MFGDIFVRMLNEVAFVEERSPDWRRMHQLCDRADATLRRLKREDFTEFVTLYRRCSTDLAVIRTQSANLELIAFMNQLVARAYAILYRGVPGSFMHGLTWLIHSYAQSVRNRIAFVMASLLTLIIGGVFGYVALASAPDARDLLVPDGFKEVFEQWKSGEFSPATADRSLMATGMYMSNNPTVALVSASASAVSFGFGSFYFLIQNGQLLGTLTHEMATVGKVPVLYANILPHGVTEVQGLVIAGAAGYVMGWALICPGRKKRSAAMLEAMKDAFSLMVGGIILMYIAAPFEGFFSFNPDVPAVLKVIVGCTILVGWILFYTFVGHKDAPPKGPMPWEAA